MLKHQVGEENNLLKNALSQSPIFPDQEDRSKNMSSDSSSKAEELIPDVESIMIDGKNGTLPEVIIKNIAPTSNSPSILGVNQRVYQSLITQITKQNIILMIMRISYMIL